MCYFSLLSKIIIACLVLFVSCRVLAAKPTPVDQGMIGAHLSLNFQDIKVRAALQLLAEFGEFNVIIDDKVQGNLSLHLNDIPWEQALDIILKSKDLVKCPIKNSWFITPQSEFLQRAKEKLKINSERQALSPMLGKLIQIQYSKATLLADLLKDKNNNILSQMGSVNVDKRGNSLWVRDSKERLAQIEKVIRQFDRPIKQIAIEARIVNVDKIKASELGAKFGFKILSSSDVSSSHSKPSLRSSMPDLTMDLPFSEIKHGKVQLNLMKIAKNIFLDLELTALENEGELKIISTPHLMTADQMPASIQAGEDIPYQKKEGGDTVIQFQPAVLSLSVTPQVLPNHQLMLDLVVNQDQPSTFTVSGTPAIHKRGIKTQVIINDGETVVLGGIYEHMQNQSIERIPFLGSLPIIGRLFSYKETSEKCNELLIFLTPTILPL